MDETDYFETPREFINDTTINHIENWQGDIFKRFEPTKDTSNNSSSDHFMKKCNFLLSHGEPNHLSLNNLSSNCGSNNDHYFEQKFRCLEDEFKAKCIALQEIQKQKMILKEKNEKLNIELLNERKRAVQIGQKIKYIQENQFVLLKMKDEYKQMKEKQLINKIIPSYKCFNQASQTTLESGGRKEFKHCQTENTKNKALMFEEDYIDDDLKDKKLDKAVQIYENYLNNTIVIKESDFNEIQSTVKLLKTKLLNKLLFVESVSETNVKTSNENNSEEKYLNQINGLKLEIENLKECLHNKQIEVEQITNKLKSKDISMEKNKQSMDIYKKIIVKMEKRQRNYIKKYKIQDNNIAKVINEDEKKIVKQIIKRYIINKLTVKKSRKLNKINNVSSQSTIGSDNMSVLLEEDLETDQYQEKDQE